MYGEVQAIERLSPSMIRLVFGGGDLENFVPTPFTDQYINGYFVPPDAPYGVPFDLEEAKETGDDFRPRPRRFTVRKWDVEKKHLTIDFVAHGDEGYAGAWAQRARIGDRLQFKGPGGAYHPDPEVDWHLFAGDESALPAISASIESLPAAKPCLAFVVVDGPEYEITIHSDSALQLIWLHRSKVSEPENALLNAIKSFDFPEGEYDVFVHGEAGEVRSIRKHLLADRGIDESKSSISPYWRRNHTDEAWRSIKRQWLADQRNDT